MNIGKKKILLMPQISRFFGIIIAMYFDDHHPPHFHAKYENFEVKISIIDFSILDGKLPSRVLGFVLEWASLHRKELIDNWELVNQKKSPKAIPPLE